MFSILEHFLLPATLCLALFAGFGMVRVLAGIAAGAPRKALGGAALCYLAGLAVSRMPVFDLSRMYCSYDYGWNCLVALPPRTVLLCEGDMDWFPLMYHVHVDGRRSDVAPLCYSMMRGGVKPYTAAAVREADDALLPGGAGGGILFNARSSRPLAATIQVYPEDLPPGLERTPAGTVQRLGGRRSSPPPDRRVAGEIMNVLKRLRYRGLWQAESLFSDRATDLIQTPAFAWARFSVWLGANNAPAWALGSVIDAYRRAVRLPLCPAGPQVRYNLALLLCRMGSPGEAIRVLERALEEDRSFDAAAMLLHRIRLETGHK